MVESKLPHRLSSTNERPLTVRRRDTELHARVNGNLTFEFADTQLTSYVGLELLDRYLRWIGFSDLVRTAFGKVRLGGDFGVIAMMRVAADVVAYAVGSPQPPRPPPRFASRAARSKLKRREVRCQLRQTYRL